MRPKFKTINLIILFLIFFLLSGCVTIYNPATGRQETLLIDTKEEVALGSKMDKETQKQLKIIDEPQIQKRLDSIGDKIAASSDRQDITYYFRAVRDKELNAFSIPGGFVYVNSGLMESATDDELACVIAHEIGHIAARHSVKKLQATMGYQIIMGLALGLSGKQSMAKAIDTVFNLTVLGYGRKDEFLSDKLAVKYAKKSGFDPYAMVTFFEKLKIQAQKKGETYNLVFLSSHPPIEERIKNVKNELQAGVSDSLLQR